MAIGFYDKDYNFVEISDTEMHEAIEAYFVSKGTPIKVLPNSRIRLIEETALGKLCAEFMHDNYHSLLVDVFASQEQAAPYLTDLTPDELAANDEWNLPVCTIEIPDREVAVDYTGKTRNLNQPGANIFVFAGMRDEASHIISLQPDNENDGISMINNTNNK